MGSKAPPGDPMMAGRTSARSSNGFLNLSDRALGFLLTGLGVVGFFLFFCDFQ